MVGESSNGQNVEYAEAEYLRKIFIGGLTSTTTDEGLQNFFAKWGTVVDAVVMKDPKTKKSRGFGFITYSDSSSVDAAQKARPHTIDGRTIEAKRAVPREDVGRPEISASTQKIYIGRIKDNISEDDLREHFGSYGNIIGVNIVKDKEGNTRGFGFVEFDDYDPVDKLVLRKEHTIKGQQVDVKKSQQKPKGGDGSAAGSRNQNNQSGFRGNNSGGPNNSWGQSSGGNFGGSAWVQGNNRRNNNFGSGFSNNAGNNMNDAWRNMNGNNAGGWSNFGGSGQNYGNGFGTNAGGFGGGNFGNFGGNFGGNSGGGGNFRGGNQANQQFGNQGGNSRNFGGNKFGISGGNQMQRGNNGPVRNQNMGNRDKPYGNRNIVGGRNSNFNN